MRFLSTVLFLVVLLAPAWAAPLRTLRFVQWSDLHWGHEQTRPADWEKACREGLALRPEALVLTGDLVDNKCPPEEFARRTEVFLATHAAPLRAAGVPLVLSLGNNDLPLNYQTDPGQMAEVLTTWRRHLGPAFYLDELGNGVCPRPVAGITWISLNSLVFSPLNQYEGRGLQARRTMTWLDRQLAALPADRPVVIASHIPPTWDQFGHAPAWEPAEIRRFEQVLEGRRAPVVVLSGHFHRNELHALSLSDGRAVPILDAGAISGKYGYRPNWRSHQWTLDSRSWPQRIRWRNRYPANPAWDQVWQVDRPHLSRTWSLYVIRLAGDSRFFLDYMRDFWANQDSWRANALQPGVRRGVLDEFFVRPRLGARQARVRIRVSAGA